MTKKAISLAEFNELEKELQLEILHNDGVHAGKRILGGRILILFQLYGFYVEVTYREYRKEVLSILTAADPEILQPYLHQINIDGLGRKNS